MISLRVSTRKVTARSHSMNGGKELSASSYPTLYLTAVRRDFLLFMPAHEPGLKAVLSYFSAGVKVNPEGDVSISDEPKHTIGTTHNVLSDIRSSLFGALAIILSPPIRDRPPEFPASSQQQYISNQSHLHNPDDMSSESQTIVKLLSSEAENSQLSATASQHAASKILPMPPLTAFLPGPGFFAAGAMSGIVSRTTTAPLDRLKVYLIAQTDNARQALDAVKGGQPLQGTKHAVQPLLNACKELWSAGGMRSLFAGKLSFVYTSYQGLIPAREWSQCHQGRSGIGRQVWLLRGEFHQCSVAHQAKE